MAEAGSTVVLASTVVGGVIRAAGGTVMGVGPLAVQLIGDGTIAPGFSPGTLSNQGTYTETVANTLSIEIGGSAHDQLIVGQTAALAGALSVSFLDDFDVDVAPASFVVLTAGILQGAFHNVANGESLRSLGGLFAFDVFYGAGSPFGANQVVISNVEFVPEPAAALLWLLTGVTAALRSARRRVPDAAPLLAGPASVAEPFHADGTSRPS